MPERAGQPVKTWVHITLADLLLLDGDSALQEEWTAQVRARWAARRAAASETGASDGAWLDGDAAAAITCDAAMAPIVTGDINVDALERPGPALRGAGPAPPRRRGRGPRAGRPGPARDRHHRGVGRRSSRPSSARPWTCCPAPAGSRRSCAAASSAPGWAGPSLPLDIGYAETIPAGIRNAVLLRDRHCQWAGGCTQPACACEVHHTTHKADGGTDVREGLRPAVPVPPPDRDSPLGLDAGRQPGRDHQRVEQEQDQSAPQPRKSRCRSRGIESNSDPRNLPSPGTRTAASSDQSRQGGDPGERNGPGSQCP